MNLDKRYWLLIGAAVVFASIASACTLYMASAGGRFTECNSVAAACFGLIGMVPCMALGVLALIPVMVAIPYLFHQNETPGLLAVLLMSGIVAYTAFDAANDVAAIMGYHQLYLVAHTVMDTTNNVTGTIIGTGESHC